VLQPVDTILGGIKKKVLPTTRVIYAKGCAINDQNRSGFAEAVQVAKNADVAVLVVGEQARREGSDEGPPPTDGEGYDVASLDLTGVQEDLVRAIHETGTPTVLVLVNGRPLSVRWEAEHVPAIVEAWIPGERGGEAVADVLFGDYNPSGRLAITVPRSVGQLPVYYNYKPSKSYWVEGGWTKTQGYVDMPGTPLYPFGYGLSYTSFQYSNARVDPPIINKDGQVRVSVDIRNTGQQAGVETAQLYIRERFTPVATPVKQLRGFQRVALAPNESKTVGFTLTPEDLQLLDRDLHWTVVPGTFDIMVGKSSAEITSKATLQVQ
jgi:beta-glucosidase